MASAGFKIILKSLSLFLVKIQAKMNSNEIISKAKQWIKTPFDSDTQKEIQDLLSSDSKDLTDRFYKDLEFGTGGMRGVMGAGTNRINKYTLGKTPRDYS